MCSEYDKTAIIMSQNVSFKGETEPVSESLRVQKDKGGPTFLTCASLIFSRATRILSAFSLAACSS